MRWCVVISFAILLGFISPEGVSKPEFHTQEPPPASKMPLGFGKGTDAPKASVPTIVVPPAIVAASEPMSIKLTPDVVLAYGTDKECVVTSSRLGYVSVSKKPGPAQIYAKFAEDPDKYQWKTYNEKWVYVITPLQTGGCELLAWEVGITDEALIQRFLIESNLGPRPPDVPTPPPITQGDLRVLFWFESTAKLTQEQANVKNSSTIRKYLNEHCAKDGYRFWDPDVNASKETPTWQAIHKAAKPMYQGQPQMIIFKGTKGEAFPVESEQQCLNTLKLYSGGA